MRSALVWLSVVCVVGVASVTVWVAVENAPASPVLSEAPVEPVVIAPVESSSSLAEPADVLLIRSDPTELLWPGAAGVVTSVELMSGDVAASGRLVATVNGLGVIALTTEQPMYRDLTLGSSGSDVVHLSKALRELGLLSQSHVDDRFGPETAAAVREFNLRRGVDSAEFSAVHTMWLPHDTAVETTALKAGAPAPGHGSVAVVGTVELTDAYVTIAESDGPDAGRRFRFVDGHEREVEADNSAYRLTEDGSIRDIERLARSVNAGDERITGAVVKLITPLTTYQLPSSAVLSGADGEFCVVDEAGSATSVEIVGAGAGSVRVAERLPDRVVVNPIRSGTATTCD